MTAQTDSSWQSATHHPAEKPRPRRGSPPVNGRTVSGPVWYPEHWPEQARWMRDFRWRVRCTAHRTDGQPCEAWSVRGGYVCSAHGGRSPRARKAALRRLDMMATAVLAARALARVNRRYPRPWL